MYWSQIEQIIANCWPENERATTTSDLDIDLAVDFADELLSLFSQFSGHDFERGPADESPGALGRRRRAMCEVAWMTMQMALEHPGWTARLIEATCERRDLVLLNAETLKESFPEVDFT